MITAAFIEPELVDPVDREGAVAGDPVGLLASRCTTCDRVDFPARERCSACPSGTKAHALRSPAVLGSRTAVLHPPPGGLVEVPYDIGVAEFPDGIAILGLLIDADAAERGCSLEVIATAVGDRLTYAFRPAN